MRTGQRRKVAKAVNISGLQLWPRALVRAVTHGRAGLDIGKFAPYIKVLGKDRRSLV